MQGGKARAMAKPPRAASHTIRSDFLQARLGLGGRLCDSGCRNILLPYTAEGMAAFLEKRAPGWA